MRAKLTIVNSPGPENPSTEPIEQYIRDVKDETIQPHPYDRLMIHYRKLKDYNEELSVIKKGILTLKNYYSGVRNTSLKKKINAKIKDLSKKIGKNTGLLDKKGNEVYLPDPLPRWLKRQSVVEQKLKKITAVPVKKNRLKKR